MRGSGGSERLSPHVYPCALKCVVVVVVVVVCRVSRRRSQQTNKKTLKMKCTCPYLSTACVTLSTYSWSSWRRVHRDPVNQRVIGDKLMTEKGRIRWYRRLHFLMTGYLRYSLLSSPFSFCPTTTFYNESYRSLSTCAIHRPHPCCFHWRCHRSGGDPVLAFCS